jgi:hypothetical protein
MATTIKGGKRKTTVGAKKRSTSKKKSRGRGQAKIGKPASKPRNKKVKALPGADESGRAGLAAAGLPLPGPPTIESAIGVADRTIRLSWHYNDYPWRDQFHFQRKNLTSQTTAEFDADIVRSHTGHYTFDDIGGGTVLTRLDPQTSYEYRVAAYVAVWNAGEILGPFSDPVTGTTPNTPFQPTFEASLLNDEGGWQGYCLVQRIEGGRLLQSGTQVQLTLRASSVSAAYIDRIYISKPDPAGNNPYDSADDLIEVNPKFEIPAGQAVTLPWVRYILDVGHPLLIAVDFQSSPPAPPSGIRWRPAKMHGGRPGHPVSFSAGVGYWRKGAEAALRNRSANYVPEDRIYLIEKIAVR